jgi:chromosomal replication initiator protein
LDDLVESSGNRMAVQAARAVVAEPASRYNPLVIVGAGGVGKTHLLHAVGNALALGSKGPVACLSAHEFTGELIEAIDRDAVGPWRARYRGSSAFLLDDFHLVAEKDRTQDELFVLFNFLMEKGRQMIFTSAVPLSDLKGVEARLRTRLEGGLVVDLPAPERELRQQVLERLLHSKSGAPDPELVGYLGSRPADSIRAMHGLLQRVLNAAETQGVAPTAALAREVLEGSAPKAPRRSASRSSGVVAPASGARSREKIVWDWPDVGDRIVEEWR